MDKVSLTYFLDFISTSGSPKLTVVRRFRDKGDYDVQADFWKRLRDAIVDFHASGSEDRALLDGVLARLADKKKLGRYQEGLRGYKRFLGRKRLAWFAPPRGEWTAGGTTVSVNPELGLSIDGQKHLLKLYFKNVPLAKLRVDAARLLLWDALGRSSRVRYAVLDVARGKLFAEPAPDAALLPLLQGEAAAFAQMFAQLATRSH